MPTTIHCRQRGCAHKYTWPSKKYPTKNQAECAERMHFGRTHKGNVVSQGQRKLVAATAGGNGEIIVAESAGTNAPSPALGLDRGRWQADSPRKIGRPSRLQPGESEALVAFIREHRKEFATKKACFLAAVEAAGIAGKIKTNSVAVDRYFKKAFKVQRRNYVRRAVLAKDKEPETGCKFCPECGLNLAVANTTYIVARRHS